MIRSIPNPPMAQDDVIRFRTHLEKHMRGNFTSEEQQRLNENKKRLFANANQIIANCGGINPILGA